MTPEIYLIHYKDSEITKYDTIYYDTITSSDKYYLSMEGISDVSWKSKPMYGERIYLIDIDSKWSALIASPHNEYKLIYDLIKGKLTEKIRQDKINNILN